MYNETRMYSFVDVTHSVHPDYTRIVMHEVGAVQVAFLFVFLAFAMSRRACTE